MNCENTGFILRALRLERSTVGTSCRVGGQQFRLAFVAPVPLVGVAVLAFLLCR